jgi:hypothetical protein
MLEEPIQEGVAPKMKGSVLMCVADTEEEVLERVRKDVYWTSDVWDKEKVSYLNIDVVGVDVEGRISRWLERRLRFAGGWRELRMNWWRIVEGRLLTVSRCRLFLSRALLGRLLTSERCGMKIRFVCRSHDVAAFLFSSAAKPGCQT